MEKLTIKRLSDGSAIAEGYGVLFDVKDLEGDTFTKDTDFNLGRVVGAPVYFDHSLDDIIESDGTVYVLKGIDSPIGQIVEVTPDNVGLYMRLKLEKAEEYWQFVESVMTKNLGLSTGSSPHLVRKDENNVIKKWPISEVSLTLTPAESRTVKHFMRVKSTTAKDEAGEVTQDNPVSQAANGDNSESDNLEHEVNTMSDEKLEKILAAVTSLAQQQEQTAAEVKALKNQPDPVVNDPGVATKTVNQINDTSHWRYDRMSLDDLAFSVATLSAISGKSESRNFRPSDAIVKALAMRLDSSDSKTDDALKSAGISEAIKGFKATGRKANEINQTTLAGYGDEWVGTAYGSMMWEKIRQERRIFNLFDAAGRVVQAPSGADIFIDPLELTDPTVYAVQQAADYTSNPGGTPSNTIPISRLATDKKQTQMGKFGSSTAYADELNEDAFVNFASQLRLQIQNGFSETFESALIDGDTATATNTNINFITGTPSNQYWLNFDGIRKLALANNNSNINGALAAANFLTVAKTLGTSGLNADIEKAVFVVDPKTYFAAIALSDVKSRDVNSAMTIETGVLTRIWGYALYRSAFMCWGSTSRLTNSSGYIDNTTQSNNDKGNILMFRPDQWKVYIRNLMKQTVQFNPRSDSWEITTVARMGFNYRDTSAAAIGRNITV